MSTANPYTILQLTPPATVQQIRKAYRKLALKTHPDKTSRDSGFLQVRQAYDALATEDGRQKWAARWTAEQESAVPFRSLRQNRGAQSHDSSLLKTSAVRTDIDAVVRLTFCESFTGRKCSIGITKLVPCPCGSHQRPPAAQSSAGARTIQTIGCPECNHTGLVERQTKLQIYAPRGVFDGHVATVPNGHDQLSVRFAVAEPSNAPDNPFFVLRHDNDLCFYLKRSLTLRCAHEIDELRVQKPCGQWLRGALRDQLLQHLTIADPSLPGDYLSAVRVRGHGFASIDKRFATGSLWVVCKLQAYRRLATTTTPSSVLQTLGQPREMTEVVLESAVMPVEQPEEDKDDHPGDCIPS
jgi:DnaJ-class molecular chaperone